MEIIPGEKIPLDAVSGAILVLGSLLGRTWRYKLSGNVNLNPVTNPENKGSIYCFFHSQILPLAFIFRGIGVKAVVSASRDGDRATAVAQRWRHEMIRGSSTRGGLSVIRQCVEELQNKTNIIIIPDGPRGPAEIVKPGAAQIALLAGAPVVPMRAVPGKAWRMRSWDRFIIPCPFALIDIRFGNPVFPMDFADRDDRVAAFTARIQEGMDQ